jgi:hypothetical protein
MLNPRKRPMCGELRGFNLSDVSDAVKYKRQQSLYI